MKRPKIKKIPKIIIILTLILAIFTSSTAVFALDYIGSSSQTNRPTVNIDGYFGVYRDDLLGYRFSVVNFLNKEADGSFQQRTGCYDIIKSEYYSNVTTLNNSYYSFKFTPKLNKYQLIQANNSGDLALTSNKNNTNEQGITNVVKDTALGLELPLPENMETWQNTQKNINIILSKLFNGNYTVDNLKPGDCILIEPLFGVKLWGERHLVTLSEIGFFGTKEAGKTEFIPSMTPGAPTTSTVSSGHSLADYYTYIGNRTNQLFPNYLYVNGWNPLGITAASKIQTTGGTKNYGHRCSFEDLLYKGYGLSMAYTTKYTVSYNANGGSGSMADQTVQDKNTAVTLRKNTFTYNNNKFIGWHAYRNTDGKRYGYNSSGTEGWYNSSSLASYVTFSDQQTVTNLCGPYGGKVTMYAQWESTISYNANGGSGSMSAQTVIPGQSVNLNENEFTRSGYTFDSWNTKADGSGTKYYDGASITVSDSTTLYAQWTKEEPDQVKVSYYKNLGSGSMSPQYADAGTAFNLKANTFTRTGHYFTGWSTTPAGILGTAYSDKQSVTLTDDLKLYAQWKSYTCTIKYNANGGSGSMANTTINHGHLGTLRSNTFTRSGYSFAGWNTQANGNGTAYSNMATYLASAPSGNTTVTLYAQWIETSCTIIYDGTKGSGSMPSEEIGLPTDSFKLAANKFTDPNGAAFLGWRMYRSSDNTYACCDGDGGIVFKSAPTAPSTSTTTYHPARSCCDTCHNGYYLFSDKATLPALSVDEYLDSTIYMYATWEGTKPTITAENQTLTVGDVFDPFSYATAYDEEDGDLTPSITTSINTVKVDEENKVTTPGIYAVQYSVTDSDENTTKKLIRVYVVDSSADPDEPQDPETPTAYTSYIRFINLDYLETLKETSKWRSEPLWTMLKSTLEITTPTDEDSLQVWKFTASEVEEVKEFAKTHGAGANDEFLTEFGDNRIK